MNKENELASIEHPLESFSQSLWNPAEVKCERPMPDWTEEYIKYLTSKIR